MSDRTLGVVGTLVWDRFERPPTGTEPGGAPREGWGGIAYSLAALSAALPGGWTARALVKVGRDLFSEAVSFVGSLPSVDGSALTAVSEPNNRVELRYRTAAERTERLSGGVPPWRWDELGDLASGCDALYVNFVSGYELELADAEAMRSSFFGPIWGDLHSLFLGRDPDGVRVPRPLPDAARWLRCFDAVQLNESELALLAGRVDPWDRAAVMAGHCRLVSVTLGARGSAFLAPSGAWAPPLEWRRAGGAAGRLPSAEAAAGAVPVETEPASGDPTGCGDVWGAAAFARLLAGEPPDVALREANRLARLKLERTGAGGLSALLRAARALGSGGSAATDRHVQEVR